MRTWEWMKHPCFDCSDVYVDDYTDDFRPYDYHIKGLYCRYKARASGYVESGTANCVTYNNMRREHKRPIPFYNQKYNIEEKNNEK